MICFFSVSHSYSQEIESDSTLFREDATKVYLDVTRRYQDYIKREVTFVNYVRDRKQAQVYILLTTQKTGSNGIEHTMTFIGQENFSGDNDTLRYVSNQTDTDEIRRRGIVRVFKIGLMRYVSKTPLADYINIDFRKRADPTAVVDKWDYWVFNINTNNRVEVEEKKNSFSIRGSFNVDRVTPYWKMSFWYSTNYSESNYEFDDGPVSSFSRTQSFQNLIVKSLGEHWSVGGYCSFHSSTYANNKFSFNVAPAIEFDVFPYSESTRREFRFLYKLGRRKINYIEETIYNKTSESLFNQSLAAIYEIKERWGSISSTLEASNYFHDFGKNRLELYSNVSLRLFEGLSLTLRGNVTRIRDQLSLPIKEATEEEILLRRKQLATGYDISFSFGFRFTFGSIYSNVVNPRFTETSRFGDNN
ncbi:hypothetical protein ACFL4Z_02955 [candidate division KSB1 bacterium]